MLNLNCASTGLEARMGRFGLDSPIDEELPPVQPNDSKSAAETPLVSSYNAQIRPLLDAVDWLRKLNVTKEGIELPTIVVVGDQSSGKSSVLESLAGISLPRGQGICTRVPLIMRLQNHPNSDLSLHLEYSSKTVNTSEKQITEAINLATEEIAGNGKGISHTPLTLVVKKKGVPDLTMVDLPGITRVPVHGQPEDIYEQISRIIMEYISSRESIILNVLSATVDFPTCESIRMSQRVDKTGERTLAVVTKADKAPEGLLEKVTADDVNIGLGYVCVRNRIGDESYEEARSAEAELFNSHPLLSKIDKSIVGIPVLAQKLVQIQANSIAKCLPEIVKKINTKLSQNVSELNDMPKNLTNVGDAMTALMRILGSAKDSLRKVLVRAEFDEFPDDAWMHCTARLAGMLDAYADELKKRSEDSGSSSSELFLMEEIHVLDETKGIGLPNFIPRSSFLAILQRKVRDVADTPVEFVREVWDYIEKVVVKVLGLRCEKYPQFHSAIQRAGRGLIEKFRNRSIDRVNEIVAMERSVDYTSNQEYMKEWARLMEHRAGFMGAMVSDFSKMNLQGFGLLDVGHLRQQHSSIVEQAFDVKMRITAYWKIVILRLVDSLALHILFSIQKLVDEELQDHILHDLVGSHLGGIESMLQETPSVVNKRDRLNTSIRLLKDSKDVVANIMDRIAAHDD